MKPLHSFAKFDDEYFIIFRLNNMYDDVDFKSPQHNIFKNHKISMIRVRTLKYSLRGCVFALLAAQSFLLCLVPFFINPTITKNE